MPRTRPLNISPTFGTANRALVDAIADRYAEWRDACHAVQLAYRRWTDTSGAQSPLAHASYAAALEREDCAATAYAHFIERARAGGLTGTSA